MFIKALIIFAIAILLLAIIQLWPIVQEFFEKHIHNDPGDSFRG